MRLIDADALRDVMFVDFFDSDDWGIISRHIDDAPTADAVQVVRCKDCKWWKREVDEIGGDFFCAFGQNKSYREDFYCADGERRSEC